MKYKSSTETIVSYDVKTAQPLDIKGFFKDNADMKDITNNDPLSYYEEMIASDSSTGIKYRWIESVVGLIPGGFTYPANYIHDSVDYSGKTFNFVPIGNTIESFTFDATFPPTENYPKDTLAIRQHEVGGTLITSLYKKNDNLSPGIWIRLFDFINDEHLMSFMLDKQIKLVSDIPGVIVLKGFDHDTATWVTTDYSPFSDRFTSYKFFLEYEDTVDSPGISNFPAREDHTHVIGWIDEIASASNVGKFRYDDTNILGDCKIILQFCTKMGDGTYAWRDVLPPVTITGCTPT